jgi:hypothetical protein
MLVIIITHSVCTHTQHTHTHTHTKIDIFFLCCKLLHICTYYINILLCYIRSIHITKAPHTHFLICCKKKSEEEELLYNF